MKFQFKRTGRQALILLAFCFGLLVLFLLNPNILYAHQTEYRGITIYHQQALPRGINEVIDQSLTVVEQAAIYQDGLTSDWCLNDGSSYPRLVRAILGDDVFTAFSDKVVVMGTHGQEATHFEQWGQQLKSSQFLSHALLHNLQFQYHGLLDANPLGRHPQWKWEGYVEYEVLGRNRSLTVLYETLTSSTGDAYSLIDLGQGEMTIKQHVRYLLATKYCFEVLGWDYATFMADEQSLEDIWQALSDSN